jgi:hypothetical protein
MTGPQLRPLATQLLKFDRDGISPQRIEENEDGVIFIYMSNYKRYIFNRSGHMTVDWHGDL